MRTALTALLICVALQVASSAAVAQMSMPRADHEPRVAGIINGASVSDAAWAARWRATVTVWVDGAFTCGGTLIDARSVLTAAHCTRESNGTSVNAQDVTVTVGRVLHADASSGEEIAVERIAVHPSFQDNTVRYDLAVLRLANAPAPSSGWTTLEPVAQQDAMWWQLGQGWATGDDLTGPFIAGWGVTTPNGSQPAARLREAKVPIAADSACARTTPPGLGSNFHAGSMLCAGVPASYVRGVAGVDACQGDSGGPLIAGDGAGTWRLVGVTSWGYGCASTRWGAYARVGAFTEWIDSQRFAPPVRPPVAGPPANTPPAGGGQTPPPSSPSQPPAVAAGAPTGSGGPVIDVTPPTRPRSVRVTNVARRSVVVRWRAARDASGPLRYELQLQRGTGWILLASTERRMQRVGSLRPARGYRLRVRAMDQVGHRSRWVRVTAYTDGDVRAPTRPGAPRATIGGRGVLVLRWARARDDVEVRRYVVERLVRGRWRSASRSRGPRARVRGLARGRHHAFRVRAIDASGNRSRPSAARVYVGP